MTAVTGGNVVYLSKNTAVAAPTGQAVATANDAVLTPQAAALVGDGSNNTPGRPFKARYMLVKMTENAANANAVVTFKAGPTGGTPANQAAYSDLTGITFTSGQTKYVQVELSRFLQADGTVKASVTGASASVLFSVINLSKGAA